MTLSCEQQQTGTQRTGRSEPIHGLSATVQTYE